MKALTPEEWVPYHHQVLRALTALAESIKGVRTHSAGHEYTSLMSCFLMHDISSARSLLTLYESSGIEWFPVTVGYTIARPMFEIDVTAHYISQSPQEFASQYIQYGHVLEKKAMDKCKKHRESDNPSWREAMEMEWHAKWEEREQSVNAKFTEVRSLFTRTGKDKGLFDNWSGKKIYALAAEVNHKEAYDSFYSELSSFTHGNVHLADKFLRISSDGRLSWSQRANFYDVGEIFHHASSFLTCYLKLFGSQFDVWDDAAVDACWNNVKF